MTFTDFHGETPTCCPGRVGFLTGQHTHNHGVLWNDARLFRPSMSLATALDDIGYRTFLAGKYLNLYRLIAPAVPPGWDRFHAMDEAYYDYPMWSNGHAARWYGDAPSDYSTDVIAGIAAREIRRAPTDRPLFGWIAPWAAHVPTLAAPRHVGDPRCSDLPPWRPPGYMEPDVSDKPAHIRRLEMSHPDGYDLRRACEALLAVDDLVARVIDALADTDRLADTMLVLTADNGMNYGVHRAYRDKKTPYATQIPFLVSWPGRLGDRAQNVPDRLVNIDFAPTICALAGCVMGPYPNGQREADGGSFAPLLMGTGAAPRRDATLHDFRTPSAWVPRWWGVATTERAMLASQGCTLADVAGCRWLYVSYETGERELYDVSNGPCWTWTPSQPGDPCMLRNRADDASLADIQAALAQRLRDLRDDP